MTLTIPSHDGGSSTLAILNLSFFKQAITSGTIDSVAAEIVTDNEADFSSFNFNQFDPDAVSKFFIEITSGAFEGLILPIVDHTSNSLTLTEDVSYLSGSGGDNLPFSFNVRAYFTIADFFGADNSTYNLRSGGNSSSSDTIYILDDGGILQRYYYQTAPSFAGGTGWRKAGDSSTDYSDKVIASNALLMARNGPETGAEISLTVSGVVKLGAQRQPIYAGLNLVGYSFPVDTSFAESGIDPAQLVSGGNASLSDTFYLLNDSGFFDRYYYQSAPAFAGGTGWRVAGDSATDQSNTIIPGGQALLVLRRDTEGFDWSDSQPF
jgi:uncharacterized protein (TIGR02597 family)